MAGKLMMGLSLPELVKKAQAAYDAMTPSQKLRHDYMQRRSFARGMCAGKTNYETHCANVEKLMPHESKLTDTEIGQILAGRALEQSAKE